MIVYPVVVGDLKGSMDRTVFYKVEDRCIGRKKSQPKENAAYSDEQKAVQLRFGFTGRLASRVRYVLRESLRNKPKHQTVPNYFVHLNMGNCTVEDLESGMVSFDYEHAVFAKGILVKPEVTASYSAEESQFTFTVAPMAGKEFLDKRASDKVYVILLESSLMQAYQLELGTRGTEATVTELLEPGWDAGNVHVYAYAYSKERRDTSDTLYLPLG